MTKYAWRQSVRVVLVFQVGLIAFFVAWSRGWIPEPESIPPRGSVVAMVLGYIGGAILILAMYGFPLWGLIPAWKSDLPGWKIWLLFLVELVLWFALFFAMLPLVQ